MDPASLASALIGAQTGQLQMAVAARILKMNNDSQKQVLQLLNASQTSANSLANVGAGIGGNLDISA